MSLFFKHLLQSIKRKPLQPFIMILTLCLAVFMAVSALSLKELLVQEATLSRAAQYGSADLTVTLNGNSKSRFMFEKDAEALLGDAATVVGTYELLLTHPEGGAPVFAVASDLHDVGRIFDLRFTAYGKVSEGTVATAAFLSKELADERGLRVGDTMTVSLFSQNVTYTVQGISPMPFLGKYDVLVDISGVVRALAERSVIAAALGEDFQPSSTLYVSLGGNMDVEACAERLRADPAFAEKTFVDVKALTRGQSNVQNLNVAIDVSVFLICALAMAVTFCCFYILADERHGENVSFAVAGARVLWLNLLQYAEVLLYWFVGTVCGLLGAFGAIGWICELVELKYAPAALDPAAMILSPAILLVASLVTVTVFILTSKPRKSRRSRGVIAAFLLLVLALALTVAVLAVPYTVRFYFGLAQMAVLLLLAFIAVPYGIRHLAAFWNARIEKRAAKGHHAPPSLCYALKNLFAVRALHNVSRLISLLVSVVILAFIVVNGAHNYITISNDIFTAKHVVVGATERCAQKLEACDEVQALEGVYFSTAMLARDGGVLLISTKDPTLLHSALEINALPSGNEAYVSKSVAESLGLEIGDALHVTSNGVELSPVIARIQDSPLPYIFFDCEQMGLTPNLYLPRFKDGVSESEGLSAISAVIADDVAVISSAQELLHEKTKSLSVYLSCGDILWWMVLLFSAIGVVDCIYNNYRARREEFGLFAVSGMSRGTLRRMKIFEVSGALLFGLVSGALVALVIIPFINYALMSFGMEPLTLFFALPLIG